MPNVTALTMNPHIGGVFPGRIRLVTGRVAVPGEPALAASDGSMPGARPASRERRARCPQRTFGDGAGAPPTYATGSLCRHSKTANVEASPLP